MFRIAKSTLPAMMVCSLLSAQELPNDLLSGTRAAAGAPGLTAFFRQIETEYAVRLDVNPKALKGAVNFFLPFPGGNGRSCATCHVAEDGFALSPATVEARWQRLQWLRKLFNNSDDPLFRSIDADD